MKNLIIILIFLPFNLLAQHWYSMDINIDKGRQNDAVQLMDDYFSKYGTEGMQVYLFYNNIGNHRELSNHSIIWVGDLQTISDGLGGKFNKGAETTLFWKRLWEMSEFVQDYTGMFAAQYGNVLDTTRKLQFCWAVKAKNRNQFIQAWSDFFEKNDPKNTTHILTKAILNRGFGGANLYGLAAASNYKEMIDAQELRYSTKSWDEFLEKNGGAEVLLHWSRDEVKSWQ